MIIIAGLRGQEKQSVPIQTRESAKVASAVPIHYLPARKVAKLKA